MSLCNCIECQRRTGSPFGVGAYYEAAQVALSGPSRVHERQVEGRKLSYRFCPDCGSTVYWLAANHPGRYGIAVGAFADPHFPMPNRSVFERSRHEWVGIPQSVPGFTEGSAGPRSR